MAAKNDNGASYQKYDGASGTYQPVDGSDFEDLNSGHVSDAGRRPRGARTWKAAAAIGLVAAAAVVAYRLSASEASFPRSKVVDNNKEQIDKAISSSGSGLQVKSNGRLKLFDSLSTCSFRARAACFESIPVPHADLGALFSLQIFVRFPLANC
jgi:hypothetical protein